MRWLLVLVLVGCSNDVDPRVIPGGGIGDGDIDGEVNIHVIDNQTDEPIAGATVTIGETDKTTDAKGLVVFSDVEGPQTISVAAASYRSAVWVGANGANVTVGLAPHVGAPESATLTGTLAGWSSINVASGHAKVAFVGYSQTDRLGDKANDLKTPNNTNICFAGAECNWTLLSRAGSVTIYAIITDRDLNGTPLMLDDDISKVIGYAFKAGVTVSGGVNQSGHVLEQVEAGNLESITLDAGTPPPGLPELATYAGIEVSSEEVIQLPLFFITDETTVVVPKPTVFAADATYRLTAVAQTPSMGDGAQSIVLRQRLPGLTLAAGQWLVPPVSVEATRTTASWDPVDGASAHSVMWKDATNELLEITVFDPRVGEVEVSNAVALPASGTLTARVQAIGADIDFNDFSLEADSHFLWGISAQPVSIP